jgi:hypothetical protein
MSLKQWHKHDPIEDEEFSLAASRISVRSPGSPDSTFIQDSTQALESRTPAKRQGDTAGGAPSESFYLFEKNKTMIRLGLFCLLVSFSRAEGPENQFPSEVVEPFIVNIKPSNGASSRKYSAHVTETPLIVCAKNEKIDESILRTPKNAGALNSGNMKDESRIKDLCDRKAVDPEMPCPAGMLKRWLARHKRSSQTRNRAHATKNFGLDFVLEKDERFLVCKPLGGIGNFVAGLLSCLAIALITDRQLILAPPPRASRDNVSTYEQPISSMFDFPLDVSPRILGVEDIPFLVDPATGSAVDTTVLQVSDRIFVTYGFL